MLAMPSETRSRPRTRRTDRSGAQRECGEEALRILLDNDMMRSIKRIGCFRVVASETVVVEPPDPLAGHRLTRIDLLDYARDRTVSAQVDLDLGGVASLSCAPAAPTLAPEEEAEALAVALADRRVSCGISLGDAPQAIMHIGHGHRSAAVLFGMPRAQPTLVAVVDLARRQVTRVVPADHW
jgi:hypothetical protein